MFENRVRERHSHLPCGLLTSLGLRVEVSNIHLIESSQGGEIFTFASSLLHDLPVRLSDFLYLILHQPAADFR